MPPMHRDLEQRLHERMEQARVRGLRRTLRILEGPQTPEQTVDGRRVLSFCSNDYLGLAADPRIIAAFRTALERYGTGSGAAHLINGHTRAHAELEEALAAFTGRPRALLFSTGYMANLGVLQTLLGRDDTVFADRLNHASLIDAVRLCGARSRRYRHADVTDLEERLRRDDGHGARMIVTDGVFSMDGDLAPLPRLAALARLHEAWLMIDDAHGLGVLGPHGTGSCGHFGLGPEDVPVLMGTLGKAFGTAGAFVAGSEVLVESLVQFARSFVYTTAMPAALAAASREALGIAASEPWRRERLARLVRHFQHGLAILGLPRPSGNTPIQPVVLGTAEAATTAAAGLLERGILVPAIRPPTVPEETARLRVTLSARHTEAQIDRLLETLREVLRPAADAPGKPAGSP